MQADQEQNPEPVPTGLLETPKTVLTDLAPDAVKAPDAPLVQAAGLGDDVRAKVPELNQARDAVKEAFTRDELAHAENDNMKREFMQAVLRARNPEVKEYAPPAVPPRIAQQTLDEQAAGRERVAHFVELEKSRPKRPVEANGTMTPVFRPSDFVPDQKKGEGLLASNSAKLL
jgi:hypothetical protein